MTDPLQQALSTAWTYTAYREHLTKLLSLGKTTGAVQTPYYIEVATLNQARMNRLDRKHKLLLEASAALKHLKQNYTLLVLTEGWCGDAAQTLPVINWFATASDRLCLKVVLRDEHPQLMDQYLTDAGRSIPKLLIIDDVTGQVVADWGPRPLVAQTLARRYRRLPEAEKDYDAYNIALHGWYARDKTKSTQLELSAIFNCLELM